MSTSDVKKLRRKSIRYSCEELLNTLGEDYPAIDNDFKVALSKYHVYLHSRGIFKLRGLSIKLQDHLGNLHEKVFSNYQRRYPKVRRLSPSAWETSKRYKKDLVSTLRDTHNLDASSKLSTNLSWKTVSLLEKLVDGDFTLEESEDIATMDTSAPRSVLQTLEPDVLLIRYNLLSMEPATI